MSNETPNDHHAKTESAPRRPNWTAVIIVAAVVTGLISGLVIKFEPGQRDCYKNDRLETKQVSIKGSKITAEVAVRSSDQAQGLSNRDCLDDDRGMLFVYDKPKQSTDICFWMKGVNFPIDMVWLDQDKKVVHIEHNVQPESYPDKSFCPSMAAQYVLELGAGKSAELGLKAGEQLTFN